MMKLNAEATQKIKRDLNAQLAELGAPQLDLDAVAVSGRRDGDDLTVVVTLQDGRTVSATVNLEGAWIQ